jgi:putative glycosyltransferase (TIGR04372 family)
MELPSAILVNLICALTSIIRTNLLVGVYSERIGHLAIEPQLGWLAIQHLKNNAVHSKSKSFLVIWLGGAFSANNLLTNLWRRVGIKTFALEIIGLTFSNRFLQASPFFKRVDFWDQAVLNDHLTNPAPIIDLNQEELREAQNALEQVGVPAGAEFVCLLARDSAYLSGQEWSYHSYRNSNVKTYELAAQKLAERGLFVLRMGSVTEAVLEAPSSRVIDYANSGMRSELLDFYLFTRCSLCLTSSTGPDVLSLLFGRPICYVNLNPFVQELCRLKAYSRQITAIPKRYLKSDGSPWTLSEILEKNLFSLYTTKDYTLSGVMLVDNTSKEICDAAIEAWTRICNQSTYSAADEKSQEQFWTLVNNIADAGIKRSSSVRVGSSFLRDFKEWTS